MKEKCQSIFSAENSSLGRTDRCAKNNLANTIGEGEEEEGSKYQYIISRGSQGFPRSFLLLSLRCFKHSTRVFHSRSPPPSKSSLGIGFVRFYPTQRIDNWWKNICECVTEVLGRVHLWPLEEGKS